MIYAYWLVARHATGNFLWLTLATVTNPDAVELSQAVWRPAVALSGQRLGKCGAHSQKGKDKRACHVSKQQGRQEG